jgi:hypothetical protein
MVFACLNIEPVKALTSSRNPAIQRVHAECRVHFVVASNHPMENLVGEAELH